MESVTDTSGFCAFNSVEDLRVPFERYGFVKDVYLPKDYYTG